jgi:predicted ATP-binding protein involved in virulence
VKNPIYIKSFTVHSLKNVAPIKVFLGNKKTHLIITGRNGSGKTSILDAIKLEIADLKSTNGNLEVYRANRRDAERQHADNPTANTLTQMGFARATNFGTVSLELSEGLGFTQEQGLCIFFSANRTLEANVPSSVTSPSLQHTWESNPSINAMIVQHLVNMKAQRAFANDDGDSTSVSTIDKWFESFKNALRELFESPNLELEFDRQELTFTIIENNKKYSFNTLSSGQSAILSIYAELLLRVQAANDVNSPTSGVILIDEPETHLHASLQKKILAFLVQAFPQFQFIITTHSPFVISSLQDTKILNLEDGKTYDSFSKYSYEAILEDYMEVDKYSIDIKSKVHSIKKLIAAGETATADALLTPLLQQIEKSEFSPLASSELTLELNSIKLTLLNAE